MADSEKPAATSDSQSAYSAPTISLPKGGGAIRGIGEKFGANPVTGTGSMTVPIATSPGRSNFGPRLSLSYDSGAGNGPFGFGWSLSIPGISRKTDKGLPQYRDDIESDVYIISGAEDLVPVLRADGSRFVDDTSVTGYTIARYSPRIEELFARIERWTNRATGEIHWRSISRDNITTLYGKTPESRVADPDDSSRVFTWLLCESYDSKGNAMVYRYSAEDDVGVDVTLPSEQNRARTANHYLKRILYGNRVSRLIEPDLTQASWLFEVVFDYDEGHYEDLPLDPAVPEAAQHRYALAADNARGAWRVRPDPFSSYRATFEVRTYRRCHRILMFHHFAELGAEPCLVRSTEFDYGDLDYSHPVPIDAELAHQGSTRFASFIRAVTHAGFVRDETRPVVERDGARYVTYLRKALPPLEFEYSKAVIQEDIREVDDITLENLPIGVDGSAYQWVDLDGEGVSGILTEQADAWFYKPNLGDGHFGPMQRVGPRPSPVALTGGRQQLLDLAGDGQLDVVSFTGAAPGFYERTEDDTWEPLRSFRSLPNIAWDDPNLRFVDLDGDGHADILLTEHEAFTWYPSLAEDGFGPPITIRHSPDEERGTRFLFADGTQSIYLADMTGDGLTDLVRIRNGEVCYWPNEGYCRFGPKVTMDEAPWFDQPDQFEQRRLRLADIDGSGTTDIVYLGRSAVRIYFNQSGNRWGGPRPIEQFPRTNAVSFVATTDLLGNGTACLVWSSPLPGDARRPLRYIDLMGGTKPHLLIRSANNLGAETRVAYASSTRFYLADKTAGQPWISRLPFPVHVLERVETYDWISGNRFTSRYAYHLGDWDGIEREFRGFGLVERWDTETFAALTETQTFPIGTNLDEISHVPPVLTKTWFHTGGYVGHERVSKFLSGAGNDRDVRAYYREPGLTDTQARELLLDDSALPNGMIVEEEREACRALKGSMLREEVYALDRTPEEKHPYTVLEQNFVVRLLQSKSGNRHAVFLPHSRESITYDYERVPSDPRIGHELTVEVDDFGNIRKSVTVGYGRRSSDPKLEERDQAKQGARLLTYTENDVTNAVDDRDDHHVPLPCDTRTYELTGYTPSGPAGRYQVRDFVDPFGSDPVLLFDQEIPYEQSSGTGRQRRLIGQLRTVYQRDDLTGALALGELQHLALPFEEYRLAFTVGLVAGVYGARVTDPMLGDEGRYAHSELDVGWWIPSGRIFFSPGAEDSPTQEVAQARSHFFLPRRYRDSFHTAPVSTETFVRFDDYDLLLLETLDALGNRTTVGERNADPTQPVVRRGHDYRVLQPALMMDPNRNRTVLAFDALGMVVATAVMGKPDESPIPGDKLAPTFDVNLTQAEIDGFLADPKGPPCAALLDSASTRIVYDLSCDWRQPNSNGTRPVWAAALARETHVSEPAPNGGVRIHVTFSYSDGFGREIQRKVQCEPGPTPRRDLTTGRIITVDGRPAMTPNDVSPRWVGSGWTVFNNKGKPVRMFEPFFSDTHCFESDVRLGVSPIVFYDPIDRVIATLYPDHSWEKILHHAWRNTTWDRNDTLLIGDPGADADVGPFFNRLPTADYLPTWYAQRENGALGEAEQDAARKATLHADTPKVVHFDSLRRTFLTIDHNRIRSDTSADPPSEQFNCTRVLSDIEGNEREVIDARDRVVMRYDYDMLGTKIHQASMEAGERWMLSDVAGKQIYTWDSRDHRLRTAYDQLRRRTALNLRRGVAEEIVVGRVVYGESRPNPEVSNLRGEVIQHFDQAGVVITDDFDFKGNSLRQQRQIADVYNVDLDWSGAVPLGSTVYANSTRYDALNRPTELTEPDNSIIRQAYNEASLLNRVDCNLRGVRQGGQPLWTPFVIDIAYDAKGQRTRTDYGNGVTTICSYSPLTLRLTHLLTRRASSAFAGDCPQPPTADWPGCHVQSLKYTHDPVGNVTGIHDDAQQTIYFRNRRVDPGAEYTYDAEYRLIEASGREHIGQVSGSPAPYTYNDASRAGLSHPGDGNVMGRYFERYVYDAVGNLLSMQHRGDYSATAGWTRAYTYDEASFLEDGKRSNRVTCTALGGTTETYSTAGDGYDAHGNMLRMPQLQALEWDFTDHLRMTRRQAVNTTDSEGVQHQGERTWYTYADEGQRVRKATELADGQLKDETIYLGALEIYRRYGASGFVRETLRVMGDEEPIALVESRADMAGAGPLVRYQFGNHLGSASLELDDIAQIISYEEYAPFGSTSYQAVRSQTETPKRYRYTGKERDEESGLYYHGVRYYAAWLGRWTSADPMGIADGPNAYQYAKSNPIRFRDPEGTLAKANESFVASATKHIDKEIKKTESTITKHKEAVDKQMTKEKAFLEKTFKREYEKTKPKDITKDAFVAKRLAEHRENELQARNTALEAKVTALKDLKTFYSTHAFTDDSLTLANVVVNEAGTENQKSKEAIAYAWLNRAGSAREPVDVEVSNYQSLGARLPGLGSPSDRTLFLTNLKDSVAAAETRLTDKAPDKSDPTQGATHWISPDSPLFDKKNGSNTQKRVIDGKVRFVPPWARDNKDPAVPGLQKGKNAILNKDYKEITVTGAPDFLFYKGVKY